MLSCPNDERREEAVDEMEEEEMESSAPRGEREEADGLYPLVLSMLRERRCEGGGEAGGEERTGGER